MTHLKAAAGFKRWMATNLWRYEIIFCAKNGLLHTVFGFLFSIHYCHLCLNIFLGVVHCPDFVHPLCSLMFYIKIILTWHINSVVCSLTLHITRCPHDDETIIVVQWHERDISHCLVLFPSRIISSGWVQLSIGPVEMENWPLACITPSYWCKLRLWGKFSY